VLHDKDTYGQGLADATKAQLVKRGVTPVLYEGLTRGEKDFSTIVTKIRGAGADVVYFGGLHPEAGPLVRQLREQGLKDVKFMSDDGIVTDELVTTAGGPQFVNGVLMTFGADPRLLPDSKTVVDEFRNMAPSQRATPCMPTRRSRPWLQRSTAPIQQGRDAAKWLSTPGQDRHGREVLDSKGDLKVSDYVVYQWDKDGKYHQLEKQK
jgi:branched-chain amino acid transport system substrate-binding protein